MARTPATALVIVVCALVAAPVLRAADHTVGGSSGWNTGEDFDSWAAGKTFAAGDTLTFSYGSLHSVYQVSKSGYKSCSTSNAIMSDNAGTTTATLAKPATTYYFICGTPGHCSEGMKLSVTTAASSSSSPSSSSTTPSTSTSTTPSSTPATTTPATTTPTTVKPSSPTSAAAPATVAKVMALGGLIMGLAGLVLLG